MYGGQLATKLAGCKRQGPETPLAQLAETRQRASTSTYSLTLRVRITTPLAVWTKWNSVVADNVMNAAGVSMLSLARAVFAGMRSVCGGPGGLPLDFVTHF